MPSMSARGSATAVESLSARLAALGLSAHAWGNGPGDRYGVHEHPYDKVLVAAAGSIEFRLPATGRAVTLVAGDRLDLPAGTAHGAQVGPEGVTCLEAHLASGSLAARPQHHPGWGQAAGSDDTAETARDRTA
jgi:quercetin dioxygenase-like cupin family protein